MAEDFLMTTITNYRNAKEVNDPIYDIEIETVELGWINTTINQNAVETDLSHMVEISQWLIDNQDLITMKSEETKLAEALSASQHEKTLEIDIYAYELIDNAYSNPMQDVTVNPIIYKNDMALRRNDKADKLAGEIALSVDEKLSSKTDQKLSEYEYKISQDRNKAVTNMLKLNTAVEVNAFDVSAENFNEWLPPV